MEINGVAHTFITAGDFAAARAFYAQLLPFLGLTVVADTVNTFYCVGGRTGFGIHAAAHEFLKKIGAHIVHGPQEDSFAPGYYSVLFEDPDGIRLEINHVPGKGLLAADGIKIGGGYADGTQN